MDFSGGDSCRESAVSDLLTDERHLSITRQSDGRPKLEVVGSLGIAGPVTVGTGFELSDLLFQVDTTTGELRGDGKLKVPAGFTIDIGLGFKNRLVRLCSCGRQ
jgi:hypothetical protein